MSCFLVLKRCWFDSRSELITRQDTNTPVLPSYVQTPISPKEINKLETVEAIYKIQ